MAILNHQPESFFPLHMSQHVQDVRLNLRDTKQIAVSKASCSKNWNFSDAHCNIKFVCDDKQAKGSIPLKFPKCPGSHVGLTRSKSNSSVFLKKLLVPKEQPWYHIDHTPNVHISLLIQLAQFAVCQGELLK